MRRLCTWLGLFMLALALAAPAFGQGCAMCYSSVAGAANSKGLQAINKAVLILLVPPVGIMGVIVGFAFKYRNGEAQQPELEEALDE